MAQPFKRFDENMLAHQDAQLDDALPDARTVRLDARRRDCGSLAPTRPRGYTARLVPHAGGDGDGAGLAVAHGRRDHTVPTRYHFPTKGRRAPLDPVANGWLAFQPAIAIGVRLAGSVGWKGF